MENLPLSKKYKWTVTYQYKFAFWIYPTSCAFSNGSYKDQTKKELKTRKEVDKIRGVEIKGKEKYQK